MKKGFILVNAYTASAAELNQPKRIAEELEGLGVRMKIVRNGPSAMREEGDFCVFLDKDRYCARMLEKRLRLFNRAEAVEVCDDKMLTHLALDGFPLPKTLPSLLCYTPDAAPSEELLREAETQLGYPMVVKECHGSLGMQVGLVKDRGELMAAEARLQGVPHLYQEFIAESAGTDLRVIVAGGQVVAAMRRHSDTDFRSNAALGGRGEPCKADGETERLCLAVAERLRLDYCGIDLLFGKEGMLVCEVNSNAFFGSIERVTGVNVAKCYAEHICRTIYGS